VPAVPPTPPVSPRLAALVVAAWLLAGCTAGPKPNAVRGKVTYKGAPVDGASVIFHPRGQVGPGVARPAAMTAADGTFVLRAPGDEGVPPGEYDVTVMWEKPPPGGWVGENRQDALGGRYSEPGKSGLQATVQSGDNDLPPFDLK
jgi:hypothetical protein